MATKKKRAGIEWVGRAGRDPRHYSSEGALLGQNDIVTILWEEGLRTVELAAGKEGHVHVAVAKTIQHGDKDHFSDQLTIYEFDANGVLVRAPFALGRLS